MSVAVSSFLVEIAVEYVAFVAVYIVLGALVEIFVTNEISQARTKMVYKQFWDSMPGLFVGVVATNVWRRVLDPFSPYANYFDDNSYSFALFIQNFLVFLIVYDGVFYFGHRLLHTPQFYARFHKRHHYPIITTWAATALHPYEILLNVFGLHIIKFFTPIPSFIHNCMLLATHFSGVIAHEENLDIYGHHLHHVKHNCNFSGYLPFWDWIFGTRDQDINGVKEEKEEKEEKVREDNDQQEKRSNIKQVEVKDAECQTLDGDSFSKIDEANRFESQVDSQNGDDEEERGRTKTRPTWSKNVIVD